MLIKCRRFLNVLIQIAKFILRNTNLKKFDLKEPTLYIEPGRSLVCSSGFTLYTLGSSKIIKELNKKYIAVDGGMADNPRYALYEAPYYALIANRADEDMSFVADIAGKCCESGDLIGVDMAMPEVQTGDIIACLTTGAYHYSMASNYNRNLIPASVLVKDGKSDIIVKRQTYSDLVRNDVVPDKLK